MLRFFKQQETLVKDIPDNTNNLSYLPPSYLILENISSGFFILDRNLCIVYVNKSIEYWIGKKQVEVAGRNVWNVFPQLVNSKFFTYYHKAMNEQITASFEEYFELTREWLEVKVTPSNEGLVGYVTNITERKNYEQKVEHMAYHDYLTDLPNRRLFELKLDESLEQANKNQRSFAIIYIDMDRFKYINDTLGHVIGDELIKQFSDRLVQNVRDKGFVSRVGADEFAVIMDKRFNDKESVEMIAKSIIENIYEPPLQINDYELYIKISLGISFYPQHGKDAQSLIKSANIALHSAEKKGSNIYKFYDPIMDIDTYKKFSLEKDLRKAIEENQLELHYQPRVNAKTGKILSAESLVRWNHPEWGMVSPDEFIPIAEETGLISLLSKWVGRTVCQQIKTWQEEGISLIPISINVFAKRFLSKDFVHNIKKELEETQLEGKWLEIEITETAILDNEKLVESTISDLKKLGVKVSLDDFGTGYSSLAYLTQFKVDLLKIDKSFIRNVTTNHSYATVVKTIIHLAHGLGMKVVAEGVETMEQLTFLKQQNCNEIQGYLFSKPVSAAEFLKLLAKTILKPIHGKLIDEFENKRKYFRVTLFFPLSSQMTIIRFKGKDITLGKTEVLIEDIGIGGLRFLSHIRLAIHADVIFELETEILGEIINVCGRIVWQHEIEDGIYQYGLEFTINEKESDHLTKLLNELAMGMKKSLLVPNCRFVKMDKINYLKHVVAQKTN
jgi:diguanylate cyclase (GGDEF)-like protein/PAS domain S-box-containing protein